MGGSLSVQEDIVFSSTLSVANNTTIAQMLSVGNDVYMSSNLSVLGNSAMTGSLSVNGDTYIRGELSLGNAVEINNTLNVTGVTTINNTLSTHGNMYINATADSALYVNTIKDYTDQQGGGTLTIDVDTLVVKGNLDVGGTYNTIDISTSTIAVEDKLLILATSSDYDGGSTDVDSQVTDGADTNNEAGLKIAGLPSSAQLADASKTALADSNVWEKSFKWQMNSGMPYLGYLQDDNTNDATYRDTESFWELKGGAFHISADKFDDDGNEITIKYGFRINANDELEIIKKTGAANSKRVAKFGITSAF